MNLTLLYNDLVDRFSKIGVSFFTVSNGYSIEFRADIENYIVKILQDFYHENGYNVLLLNQNGNCRVCLEVQSNDLIKLLQDIRRSLDSYIDKVDYILYLDKEAKHVYNLFKKSLLYSGNFGIGVKNLA